MTIFTPKGLIEALPVGTPGTVSGSRREPSGGNLALASGDDPLSGRLIHIICNLLLFSPRGFLPLPKPSFPPSETGCCFSWTGLASPDTENIPRLARQEGTFSPGTCSSGRRAGSCSPGAAGLEGPLSPCSFHGCSLVKLHLSGTAGPRPQTRCLS